MRDTLRIILLLLAFPTFIFAQEDESELTYHQSGLPIRDFAQQSLQLDYCNRSNFFDPEEYLFNKYNVRVLKHGCATQVWYGAHNQRLLRQLDSMYFEKPGDFERQMKVYGQWYKDFQQALNLQVKAYEETLMEMRSELENTQGSICRSESFNESDTSFVIKLHLLKIEEADPILLSENIYDVTESTWRFSWEFRKEILNKFFSGTTFYRTDLRPERE